jgi:hypothetical protein
MRRRREEKEKKKREREDSEKDLLGKKKIREEREGPSTDAEAY